MRQQVHSDRLDLRVHPDLKAAIFAVANERQMSPAEAAREALRQFIEAREAA